MNNENQSDSTPARAAKDTDLWLGLDVGTTAIKAALYTPAGTLVSTGQVPSAVQTGEGGTSQQDMEAVWNGACAAIRQAIAGADATRITSIGVAAQGDGLWALDSDKQPVGPAILWNDTRAADQVTRFHASGEAAAVGRACNTSIWPGTSGAIYKWLEGSDRQSADRIAHLVHCSGWIAFRLTGELAVDFADASIPFLDLHTGTYSAHALRALGCEPLADKLCTPRAASSQLGKVTGPASAATGLPVGLPSPSPP